MNSENAATLSTRDYRALRIALLGWDVDKIGCKNLVANVHQGNGEQPYFWCNKYQSSLLLAEQMRKLDPDRTLYGLDSGFGILELTEANAQSLAQLYYDEILSVQPQGPYYLGGHCYGAGVMLIVANKLKQAGHQVNALVLVEHGISGFAHKSYQLLRALPKSLGLLMIGKKKLPVGRWLAKLTARLTHKHQLTEPSQTVNNQPVESSVYSGRVLLIFSEHSLFRSWITPMGGLGRTLKGQVKVNVIPGDHVSLQEGEGLIVMAELINKNFNLAE